MGEGLGAEFSAGVVAGPSGLAADPSGLAAGPAEVEAGPDGVAAGPAGVDAGVAASPAGMGAGPTGVAGIPWKVRALRSTPIRAARSSGVILAKKVYKVWKVNNRKYMKRGHDFFFQNFSE